LLLEETFVDIEAGATAATALGLYQSQETLGMVDIEARVIRKLS
jgi:hypothetical protein